MSIQWQQWWDIANAHHVVQAILILVGCYVLARTFYVLVDRLLERSSASSVKQLHITLAGYVHRPIYYTIFLIGFSVVANVMEVEGDLLLHTQALLHSVLVVIWGVAIRKVYRALILLNYQQQREGGLVNLQTKPLFDGIMDVLLVVSGSYFILLAWNVEPTGWVASLGIGGLLIGIAAKDTLGNAFAGVFLLTDMPYVKGDYVVLNSGERGYINKIGLRSTRIMTRDDIEIIVPNAVIANNKVINESGGPMRHERIRVDIGVGYDSDMDEVETVLLQVALDNASVCRQPTPRVRFRRFGESALELQLLFWIAHPGDRGRVVHEINKAILVAFRAHAIDIPYPQLELRKKNTD